MKDCFICNGQLENYEDSFIKCKYCGLISRTEEYNPQNYKNAFWEKANYSEFTGTDFSDKAATDLVLLWKSWYSYCSKYIKGKILDVGSGTGISLVMFDKKGFHTIGIEPDEKNCEKINGILKNGKCINGFFDEYKSDEKFDVIWITHVIEHVQDPLNLLNHFVKLLNKNGVLFIAVPDCDGKDMLRYSLTNPFHMHHFSKNSLSLLVQKLNLNTVKFDSLREMNRTIRRCNKILRKIGLESLSDFFFPYYPFTINNGNNGYELRIILQKR